MLSDALRSYGDKISDKELEILSCGCLSPHHATQFRAFVKQIRNRYALSAIISGEQKWPHEPENRDALYFLAQSFRSQLIKELPADKNKLSPNTQIFAALLHHADVWRHDTYEDDNHYAKEGLTRVGRSGRIYCHPKLHAEPEA
ncbi:hypothetical protein AGMMS50225_05950 [Betaproteobacteria bacterium]|nr:hypothetical protein AGMMS50225_05950 [Betaproteobacteria bacterium]